MDYDLSYNYTLDACSKPSLTKQCDYAFWREKAFRQGIPRSFFDLVSVRNALLDGINKISPAYRYLELIARKSLPEETLAVYEDGKLVGLYESYYGLWLAVYRNNEEAIRFFFSSLDISPEVNNVFWLSGNLTNVSPPAYGLHVLGKLLNINIPEPPIPTIKENTSRKELLKFVEQGNGQAFKLLAEKYVDFALLRSAALSGILVYIKKVPFPSLTRREKEDLVLAGAQGGNSKMLDYIENQTHISLNSLEVPIQVIQGIHKALLYNGDVISIYSILSKLPGKALDRFTHCSFGMTTDLALLILNKRNTLENYYNIIYYNLGNLDLLLTLLPLRDKYRKRCLELANQEKYFPLGWNNASFLDCSVLRKNIKNKPLPQHMKHCSSLVPIK